MAITRAQEARQLRRRGGIMGSNAGSMLVTPTLDGSRPGYYGPDAGFGDDDYKDAASSFQDEAQARVDAGGYGGGTEQQFEDTRRALGTAEVERRNKEKLRKEKIERLYPKKSKRT